MNTKETAVNRNVETLDINLDEIFNGAPSAGDVTLPEESKSQPNILSGLNKKADFSFTNPQRFSTVQIEVESQLMVYLMYSANLLKMTKLYLLMMKNHWMITVQRIGKN